MITRRDVLCAPWLAGLACRTGSARFVSLDEERAARRVPGAAITVIRRGAPDEAIALGDVDVDTRVEVASLSKPVFAYAVLSLAARGELALDAPIARISPPPYRHVWRGGESAFADPALASVTPRLLLAHRAGLPNWSRARPLEFTARPGGAWQYSGEGYVLLQRALEAAGHPLVALTEREVFAPLGMTRSTFDPGQPPVGASGHDRNGAAIGSSLAAPSSATSLRSTARDYARFVRRLVEAPIGDPIVDAMTAPQVEVDPARGLTWGTGIALAAPAWWFHWGANPGFRALFVASRARGIAVLALTDGDAGMELAARAVRERLGELPLLGFPMLYPDD